MKDHLKKSSFKAKGMTCHSCEKIIARQAMKIKGVKSIDISYETEKGTIEYDASVTNLKEILKSIDSLGYSCCSLDDECHVKGSGEDGSGKDAGKEDKEDTYTFPRWVAYSFVIIGILIAGYFLLQLFDKINLPAISAEMSYGLIFIVGLLTGFHCIAMCGGFVLSYTAKGAAEKIPAYKLHALYAIGKTASYTIIGAIFGFVGSIIAFTPAMRGAAAIIAGVFLLVFGLRMLNIFPSLRRFSIPTPAFIHKIVGHNTSSNPLVIGLLNGLMIACGPLQAMYILAAGTGSAIEGAKTLFIFGIGTLPVMIGFGYLASVISSKFAHKIVKVSAVVVIVLGLIMVNRGLALTGTGYDIKSLTTGFGNSGSLPGGSAAQKEGYQEIRMDVLGSGWSPATFVLKKGVPVKWIIDGKELNGCNNAIQVPKLGLEFKLKPGLQTIEFTPTEEGIVPFSCWMGMVRGTFIVKSDIDLNDQAAVQKELAAAPAPKGGSCGGSGGGCGCGG